MRTKMTIKETVRGAQDILARMALCQYIRDIQDQVADANESLPVSSYHLNNPETGATFWTPFSSKSPGPPQSLGELCLEIFDNYLGMACVYVGEGFFRRQEKTARQIRKKVEYGICYYDRHVGAKDIWISMDTESANNLRRAMYHRSSAGPMFAKGDGDTK